MKIKTFLFLALSLFAFSNVEAQAVAPNAADYEQTTPPNLEGVTEKQTPEEKIVQPQTADPDSLGTWLNQVKTWFVGDGNPIDTPTEFNGRVYVLEMLITLIFGFLAKLIPGINKIPKQRYRIFAIVLVSVGGLGYGFNMSLVQILGLLGSSGLAMFIYKEWIAPLIKSEDISNIILRFLGGSKTA